MHRHLNCNCHDLLKDIAKQAHEHQAHGNSIAHSIDRNWEFVTKCWHEGDSITNKLQIDLFWATIINSLDLDKDSYVDSSATWHIIGNRELFKTVNPIAQKSSITLVREGCPFN
jgi:hypothetical protein